MEIESVEAVVARERSGEQIVLLGDVRAEASEEGPATRYATRLKGRVPLDAGAGEYRRARLSAQDRLDDDWYFFADITKLDLVIRVEWAPLCLEAKACDFL